MNQESWNKQLRELIDTAMGRIPADLVVRDGIWVCVQTGELIPHTDIAIKNGMIAFIGADASHCFGKKTKVIPAKNRFLVPGLLDAHVHVESGMLTVTEFTRAVLPHGTTGLFIDPHEIANVFGLGGVRLMVEEARKQPIHVWVQVPACVPSSPKFEKGGVTLTPQDISEMLTWEGVIGLGEVMDFPAVAEADEKMLSELTASRRMGKVIGGHYASLDLGLPFHGYVAGGAEDDHESTTLEGALQRARQGMKVMLRHGSAWQDVNEQVKAVTELGLDSRRFLLCTDDSHAETLVNEGHMDRVIRHAISQGLPAMTAIQMATVNTAAHFGLEREIGMLAPGRWADLLLVTDLQDFRAEMVFAKGEVAVSAEELKITLPSSKYPGWLTDSVHLKQPLTPESFRITAGPDLAGEDMLMANVIAIIENQAGTHHKKRKVSLMDGEMCADIKTDLAKLALVDRQRGTQEVKMGLVHGFGFDQKCAVATTVCHDNHQLLVVGTDDACMAKAVNELKATGGGQVVVKDGKVIALIELPIGGLMSSQKAFTLAKKAAGILAGFKACGCKLNNPNMQLSLLALVVIPELRISEGGLVDVVRNVRVPLLERIGE